MFEAIQQYKDDDLINGVIDEVTEPQLRQVVIETWCEMAEADRDKQINKVTNPLKSLSSSHKFFMWDCAYKTCFLQLNPNTVKAALGSRSIIHFGEVSSYDIVSRMQCLFMFRATTQCPHSRGTPLPPLLKVPEMKVSLY